MKYTLLEIVQNILESLGDDEVDNIADTNTSAQVANIVKQAYFDIVGRADLPEHYDFFELQASGDTLLPTVMYLPDTVLNINFVKYNTQTATDDGPILKEIKFRPLNEFLDLMYQIPVDSDDTTVSTFTIPVGTATIDQIVNTDKFPEWYTTANDHTLLFDSYDSSVDTFLVSNKTVAYGQLAPGWTASNTFVPDLDSKQFSLLINEAKALAFYELKDTVHQKAEQLSRKNWLKLQKDKRAVPYPYPGLKDLPNYGRKK